MSQRVPELEEIDIIIVDAFSLLFRAYYSFPMTLTSTDGQITNAVYGFARMLLSLLAKASPKYLITATDMEGDTFRHEAFADYKANREEPDIELKEQIPLMFEFLETLNIPTLGVAGYEADDVIGTLAKKLAQHEDLKVGIFTSDRDMLQLVNGHIFLLWPRRGKGRSGIEVMGEEAVVEKLKVKADQVIDYKALCGDSSDNIPGIKGVGPKTAVSLLQEFGHLSWLAIGLQEAGILDKFPKDMPQVKVDPQQAALLASKAKEISPSVKKKLSQQFEQAWLSWQLAAIELDVPIEMDLEMARLTSYDKSKAIDFFERLGFSSLKKRLPADEFESQVQASLFG